MITAALCLFLYGTPTCHEPPTYEQQTIYSEQHYNPRSSEPHAPSGDTPGEGDVTILYPGETASFPTITDERELQGPTHRRG